MWEESWINLAIKMKDMPYHHYDPDKPKEGTIDDLKYKFGKHIVK